MIKSFWTSKINWIAAITVFLGFAADPKFLDLVDPWWSATILKVVGVVTFIIRTWFPRNPEA